MSKKIRIRVNEWNKYQPQSDRYRHKYWFRVNSDCAFSNGLFGLSAEQCWFWIQLLSECCRKNSAEIEISVNRLTALCKISESVMISAISLLEENGTVSVLPVDCQESDSIMQNPVSSLQPRTNVRTNKLTKFTKSIESLEIKNPDSSEFLEKETFPNNSEPEEILNFPFNKISRLVGKKILTTFSDLSFRESEFTKMDLWLTNNPHKNPKSQRGWGNFVSGWLNRGWDQYRKSLSSNPPETKGVKVYHEELWKPFDPVAAAEKSKSWIESAK